MMIPRWRRFYRDHRDQGTYVSQSKRRNLVFLAVALALGCSFFARHVAGMIDSNWQYNCLLYNPKSVRESPPAEYDFLPDDVSWDETRAYARWTNELIRGEWGGATLGSFAPFLTTAVPRQPLWLRDRLGILILSWVYSVFGRDVRDAFLSADLLFPIGTALALLTLCWELRPSLSFGIAATSVIMVFNWQDLLNFVAFLHGARQNEAIFLRTPYPQFSMIVFCLFLMSLLRLIQSPTFARCVVFVTFLEINFLTYFYSWTYALMFAGSAFLVLAMSALFLRLQIAPPSQTNVHPLLVGATSFAFIVAFPVWLGIVQKDQVAKDAFLRLGGVVGHTPDLRYSIPLSALFLALLFWRNDRYKNRWFAMIFLLASLLIMNVQVITGVTIQPGHWTGYYIQPIFLLLAIDSCWICISGEGKRTARSSIAIALMLAAIGTNVYKLSVGAKNAVEYNQREPEFEQVIDLLRLSSLGSYGFLSNDAYLSTVLPAYVVQKPLLPWYMDPLTNHDLELLQDAAQEALHSKSAPFREPDALTLRTDKILFVTNVHRAYSSALLVGRKALLRNEDFLVLAPDVLR